jgi:four helix bundle protein
VVKDYKELEVWQKSVKMVVEIYKLAKTFPPEEKYGLVSQVQRSATSIPANIAEGWARGSTKEYINFLMIARGSLMELETHLIVSAQLGFLNQKGEPFNNVEAQIASIGMMLNRLIKSLKNRLPSRNPSPQPRAPI